MQRTARSLPLARQLQFQRFSTSTRSQLPDLNQSLPKGGPEVPADYCAALVKKLDPEAWLCSYFWPSEVRASWLGWRAFNLELHLVSTTVSQPAIAAIRFQFWRDALKLIWEDKPPQHPVALQLNVARKSAPIQRYYLKQLIETRAKALAAPLASPTLAAHLELHGPLSSALLSGPLPMLLPPTHPKISEVDHSLSHIASLLTTVSLLRSLPLQAAKRQLALPHDLREKHGVVEEHVFREGSSAHGFRDACFEIGTRGMDELITARSHLKDSNGRIEPRGVMPIFLSAVSAESYLQRLEAVDFDVFSPELRKADWKLAPRIWWAAQTRKL